MTVTDAQVAEIVAKACPVPSFLGRRVLLIVPDGTRTAPVGLLFQTLHEQIGGVTKSFDLLIALGTHQPINEAADFKQLENSATEKSQAYRRGKIFKHTLA